MRAVEGSLLVVDASQGVEAQTLANVYQAIDAGHEIVPVLNKIDLPAAEPARVREQIEDVIGIDASDAVEISAKTGLGIPDVLEAIVTRLPAPTGDPDRPAQGHARRQLVRRLPRRRRPRPHLRRHPAQGRPHPDDADRRPLPGRAHRHLPPRHAPRRRARPRRDRLSHRLDQAGPRHPRRRHHHHRAQGHHRPRSPASSPSHPGGLLRPLPRRRRRLHRAPRRHREAPAQRRLLLLRDGDLRRPRLRLPLRLPRPPPPRGDPRPPRARVRPRPHHHRPLGDLPHPPDRRHACSSCTTPPTCPTRSASTTSRSRASRRPSSSPTTTSATS